MIGDKFPYMEVSTTKGKMELPSGFSGKWFVLFSHPADFTAVCTTEFYSFQENYSDFKKINCELIGLSVDQISSHLSWTKWIKENLDKQIEFPIIEDLGNASKLLGMVHPNQGTRTIRGVYIVDTEGIVRAILEYPQEIGRNIPEILRIVKSLQASDKRKMSAPANWPENELIGDSLILPSPKNEKEMQKLKNKQGYDWWFRYTK